MDTRLLGEWEDPDPKDKRKEQTAIIVSEIPGQNRYKIYSLAGKKQPSLRRTGLNCQLPSVLEVRQIKPGEDGYYLCLYEIDDDKLKAAVIHPPPDGKNASRDELKRYVVQVIEEEKIRPPDWLIQS